MRASGSYESLIRGVSQQVPHDRAVGQHTAQVNLLSDPVNGLTRRHGSQLVAEKKLTALSVEHFEEFKADTNSWRTLEGSYNLNDYVILYRTAARPAGSTLPVMIVYCKTTQQFLNLVRPGSDALLDQLEEGGISAAVFIGRFLFMAGNSVLTVGTQVDRWNNPTNQSQTVVWIRAGAFDRTFRAAITKTDGTVINYSVTTPAATYPGVLDTSAILTSDPDYTKKVNDIVNEYTSDVNEWIRVSTFQTQPSNMAAQAALELTALGVTASAVGSHVVLSGVKAVSVNDGGDGTLLRGVAQEVESVDKLSPLHYVGKVVKVRTRNTDEAFYMKAIAKNSAITAGVTEVTWVEAAGVEYSVLQGLFFGTVDFDITTAYIASSPAGLNALYPTANCPNYAVSVAGDEASNPVPYVANRKITYLGSFQDRLLVGSGGVVVCSKVGDYLNFFRSTVLSVPADDAFEMKSQGPDDDVLRHSVLYDQSLVIFGDKKQYVISGKVALSPTNASMPVMSAYADAALCPPHVAGGVIFYAKSGERFANIAEIQPGRGLQNSPESFPSSSQIDSYLDGKAIELTSNAEPSTLLVRTTGSRNSVYTFFYVDKPDGRKVDAWSRWDFDAALGLVIGMSPTAAGVHLYYLREGHDGVYVVCDLCPMTVGLANRPYLDSQRPVVAVIAGTGSVRGTTPGPWQAAYDYTAGTRQWLGSSLADAGALMTTYPGVTGLVVGAPQVAYFEPTNPYMRDGNGNAILSGRLTITSLRVATDESAGFRAVVDVSGTQQSISFTGRVVGSPNVVGVEYISTNEHTVPIGRETRAYSVRLSGRSWLPFTVTAIEWSGQYFNRTQRF